MSERAVQVVVPALLANEANIRAGKFDLLTGDVEELTDCVPVALSATLAAAKAAAAG